MLLIMLLIGGVIAIATVVMSYLELIPFLRALKQLNTFTGNYPTFKNHLLYSFRFLSLLKLAYPVMIDVVLAGACGLIGLSGGVLGALIGLIISFSASVALKVHRHWISPKFKTSNESWYLTSL